MYKIALCGKAGTGKNTAAEMMIVANDKIYRQQTATASVLAFADPIKEIVKTMFPHVNPDHLYGPSKFRNEIIVGAKDAEGNPLTIRRALLDIGTKVGRAYNDSVWLDNMKYRIDDAVESKQEMIIITDVRFRNEFNWLKDLGFFMIKVVRNTETVINHISETNQDDISEEEYDYILNNNGTMNDLLSTIKKEIFPIVPYV